MVSTYELYFRSLAWQVECPWPTCQGGDTVGSRKSQDQSGQGYRWKTAQLPPLGWPSVLHYFSRIPQRLKLQILVATHTQFLVSVFSSDFPPSLSVSAEKPVALQSYHWLRLVAIPELSYLGRLENSRLGRVMTPSSAYFLVIGFSCSKALFRWSCS